MRRSSTMLLIAGAAAFLLLTVPGVRGVAGAFAQTLVQFVTGGALGNGQAAAPAPRARGAGYGEG
jgi:hypothetical protein